MATANDSSLGVVGKAQKFSYIEADRADVGEIHATAHFAPVVTLTDAAAAGAIGGASSGALLRSQSGSIVTIPALTGGNQTLTIPQGEVGMTFKFIVLPAATIGQTVTLNFNAADSGTLLDCADAVNVTDTWAAGGAITIKAAAISGDTLDLMCVAAGTWRAVGFSSLATTASWDSA